MASEDSPVDLLRQSIREQYAQERREYREIQVNSRRSALGEVQSTQAKEPTSPEEVKALAEKLKHKSHFTIQDFSKLNSALIQSKDNIIAFFTVTGALHALVRELLGQNASLQLAAANCCCNLSRGDAKLCLQLTKAAAPYLLSHLDGLNRPLMEMCVWTLGNLAGSDIKSWEILHSQGLLPKLLHLVTSSGNNVLNSVIYGLTHYVRMGLSAGKLGSEQQRSIAAHVHILMAKDHSSLWLTFLLSSSGNCDDILLGNSVVTQSLHLLAQPDQEVRVITALVRILGNMSVNTFAAEVILKEASVVSVLRSLLTSPHAHVKRETLWLIGNLVNHPSIEVQDCLAASDIENILGPLLSDALTTIS